MLRREFGKKLKELRERRGLTQEDLAELSGLSDRQIRNYESGDQGPRFDNLEKICEALNIHPRDFFDFEWSHR